MSLILGKVNSYSDFKFLTPLDMLSHLVKEDWTRIRPYDHEPVLEAHANNGI